MRTLETVEASNGIDEDEQQDGGEDSSSGLQGFGQPFQLITELGEESEHSDQLQCPCTEEVPGN